MMGILDGSSQSRCFAVCIIFDAVLHCHIQGIQFPETVTNKHVAPGKQHWKKKLYCSSLAAQITWASWSWVRRTRGKGCTG